MQTLSAKPREKGVNLKNLRAEGEMPAVLYGKKQESTSIFINQSEFSKLWENVGESTIIGIKLPNTELEALIHDVDIDPVTGVPRHADFYVFERGQKIEVEVPIEFVGVAPGVKDLGGVLVKVRHEINIEAMPKDLPPEINVDISVLRKIGDSITAGELALPTGVTLADDPEDTIISISEPKEEEPEETTEEIDMSQIEVEKKGKEREEGEEGAGDKAEEKSE